MSRKVTPIATIYMLSFIWFSGQFSGGLASGQQIFQFFINYGHLCVIMAVLAQFIMGMINTYTLYHSRRYETYDYRSFTDSLYGKFSFIGSNLYELCYFIVLAIVLSVTFATGGSTLSTLLGMNYTISTVIIGVIMVIIIINGTEFVSKATKWITYFIIGGLMIVYIPNIIASWDEIVISMNNLRAGSLPTGHVGTISISGAIFSMIKYASFQVTGTGMLCEHARTLEHENDSVKFLGLGVLINSVLIAIITLGLLIVASVPDIQEVALPSVLLAQQGVAPSITVPVISIFMLLGVITTGVLVISGAVTRITSAIEKRADEEKTEKERRNIKLIIIGIFMLMSFGIAQFGLISIIAVGYNMMASATLFVVVIPWTIRIIMTLLEKQKEKKEPTA